MPGYLEGDVLHLRHPAVPALTLAMGKGHAAQAVTDGEMPQHDELTAVGIHAETAAARAFAASGSNVALPSKQMMSLPERVFTFLVTVFRNPCSVEGR